MKRLLAAFIGLCLIATGASAYWQSRSQVAITTGGTVAICGSGWTGPTSGLTHCWPLDAANVSGTTVNDVIGADTATAGSSVTAGTGPSGTANTARTFPGTTGNGIYLSADPSITSSYSVFFWINKANDTGNGGDQRWICFGEAPGVMLANGGAGVVDYKNGFGTGFEVNSTSTVSSGTWHHVGVTWDGNFGTGNITYLDGVVLPTPGAGVGDACDGGAWSIGDRSVANGRTWAGSMATVVIYNRVLSGAEVTQLMGAF